jgi:hypothetical protein
MVGQEQRMHETAEDKFMLFIHTYRWHVDIVARCRVHGESHQ